MLLFPSDAVRANPVCDSALLFRLFRCGVTSTRILVGAQKLRFDRGGRFRTAGGVGVRGLPRRDRPMYVSMHVCVSLYIRILAP